MIAVKADVLEHSFEHLRRCGNGTRECVVIWTGPLADPGHVDQVLHPAHTASPGGYDIDPEWVGELWVALASQARTVLAQAHTHPGAAYHSPTDDQHALIHTAGYHSLVIPNFASGPISLHQAFLAIRDQNGEWQQADPHTEIKLT